MSELKNCPFCGNEADILTQGISMWAVECLGCGVHKPNDGWYTSRENAIKYWNERTHPWDELSHNTEIRPSDEPDLDGWREDHERRASGEHYNKPLPVVGVKWPEKVKHSVICQLGSICICGANSANEMHDAFMSEIAKMSPSNIDEEIKEQWKNLVFLTKKMEESEKAYFEAKNKLPRLKEIEDKELYEALQRGHIRYANCGMHGEMELLTFMADEVKSHFGTRVLSEEVIDKVIQSFTNCETFTLTCSDKISTKEIAKAILKALEGR